jgi:hypothetical protein
MSEALSAKQVLDAVRTGTLPQNWHVMHATKGYFLGQGAFLTFLGLLIAFPGGLLLFVLLYMLATPSPTSAHDNSIWLVLVAALLIVAGGIGFVIAGIKQFRRIKTAEQEVLVLMPQGFVQGDVSSGTPTRGGWYSELLDIKLEVTAGRRRARIHLNIQPELRDPWTWDLDGRFEPPDHLAQRILSAFATYHTTPHATRPSHRGARADIADFPNIAEMLEDVSEGDTPAM